MNAPTNWNMDWVTAKSSNGEGIKARKQKKGAKKKKQDGKHSTLSKQIKSSLKYANRCIDNYVKATKSQSAQQLKLVKKPRPQSAVPSNPATAQYEVDMNDFQNQQTMSGSGQNEEVEQIADNYQ